MIDPRLRTALLANLKDLPQGDSIVVGLSGGADSVALVRAAVHVGRELSINVGALIIDHQLQADSAETSQAARTQAQALGANPVVVIPVVVSRDTTAGGLENAARDARRAAFATYCAETGTKAVLLGHTRDDQAETVLLGLARGSGARSLSGMRPIDGIYRRPMLALSREHIRSTVTDLETFEDPHNSNPDFLRVRTRINVLPVMEAELGPGISAALARTSDMLRDDADALDTLAAQISHEEAADVDTLTQLLPAVRTRVLRRLCIAEGCNQNDLTREHITAVDSLITNWHGQGPLNLPGAVNVQRAHGRLTFTTTK